MPIGSVGGQHGGVAKRTPTDQSSNQDQWGPPLKGHQGEAMKSIIEDRAH
jgi:hypothetical protein